MCIFIINVLLDFPESRSVLTGPVDFYLPLFDLQLTPAPLAPVLGVFLIALDGSTRYDIKGS